MALVDRLLWRFETRIVWPLMDFGLLEGREDPETAGDLPRRRRDVEQVRKTPLFDRFVSFGIGEARMQCGVRRAPTERTKGGLAPGSEVARLKATLKGIRPPMWRRIEVSTSFSLCELSDVMVAALGWSNSHLHEFEIAGRGEQGRRLIGMTDEPNEVGRFSGPPVEDDR